MAGKVTALVNIVGPEGRAITAGDELPDTWPPEFVESLIDSGGAEREGTLKRPSRARKET